MSRGGENGDSTCRYQQKVPGSKTVDMWQAGFRMPYEPRLAIMVVGILCVRKWAGLGWIARGQIDSPRR